jgi:hypothetical protein
LKRTVESVHIDIFICTLDVRESSFFRFELFPVFPLLSISFEFVQ